MKKRETFIYWIVTLWLALGMTSTAIVQVFHLKTKVDYVTHLGYPVYFITLLGIWKFLGVIAVLLPKFPLLKEWAYAGFFFTMLGAIYSHLVTNSANELFGSSLLLVLTFLSWYFRPADRKLVFVHQ